jgi:hypothetical protein
MADLLRPIFNLLWAATDRATYIGITIVDGTPHFWHTGAAFPITIRKVIDQDSEFTKYSGMAGCGAASDF